MNGISLPLYFPVINIPVKQFRFRQLSCAPFLIGSGIPLSVSVAGTAQRKQFMSGQRSMRSGCRVARLSFLAVAGVVAASIVLAATPLRADTYNWVVSTGDWSNAGNWLGLTNSGGKTLPTSSDGVFIANGGTATITHVGETCNSLTLGNASVQMTGGGLTAATAQTVGFSGAGDLHAVWRRERHCQHRWADRIRHAISRQQCGRQRRLQSQRHGFAVSQ